jgi:arylsulfatase
MNPKFLFQWTVILCAVFALTTASSFAQQVTGTLGAPSATTTIDGKQLPPPDPKFGGVIKQKASESTGWWPPRVVPPKGAPNVLLIMTDDCGFGAPGVRRRNSTQRWIASWNRTVTQFHSRRSAHQAAHTDRIHHSVGFGVGDRDGVSRL